MQNQKFQRDSTHVGDVEVVRDLHYLRLELTGLDAALPNDDHAAAVEALGVAGRQKERQQAKARPSKKPTMYIASMNIQTASDSQQPRWRSLEKTRRPRRFGL